MFILHSDDGTSVASVSDGKLTFELPANRTYIMTSLSTAQNITSTFNFSKSLICLNVCKLLLCSTATYDVQDPHAKPLGNGTVNVTGNFIDNSSAVGCFLAIESNITTEIIFFALKRKGREQKVSKVISLPPSNYTVYAHDLEEGAVINPHPANLDPDNVPMVTVTGGREFGTFFRVFCMGHYK